MLSGRCSLACSFTHPVDRRDELPQLPSGAGGLIRSLRVNRLAKRQDLPSNISSDIRVIITTYRTKRISDDHPYIWRYTARRALVIFDHPYNADSGRLQTDVNGRGQRAQITWFCGCGRR